MAWVTPTNVATGDVLTASKWNQDVVENTSVLYGSTRRLAYETRTTSYDINQTALASAADCFASDLTWTADGTSAYVVEMFAPLAYTNGGAGSAIQIDMVNGAGTSLQVCAFIGYGDGTRQARNQLYVKLFYTPSAGSTSINFRGIYVANAGGLITTTGWSPIWAAVYGPDVS